MRVATGSLKPNIIPLGTEVPHYGVVSAVKMGKFEREYLLIDKYDTVSWLSQSDIETMIMINQ